MKKYSKSKGLLINLFLYKLLELLTLQTNYNKLKKIKNFIIILRKFVFSDIINGYWMEFMAINAVTDLEDNLFCFLKQRDRKVILENSLTFLWSAILYKKIP